MKKVTFTCALASLTILMGLAQSAHAQALELDAPALRPEIAAPSVAPSLRIEQLREEASHIDIATPAILTAVGGAAVIGGLVLAVVDLLAWSLSGFYTAALGGGDDSSARDWMIGGLGIAAAGVAVLTPSAIWLRDQTRRSRAIRRELRDLSIGLGPTGVTVRGTF